VFVDIEPEHHCIDPEAVAAAVTDRTAAVMPVHLYGHPADMTALARVCDQWGLLLVEDAAQAHGATWDGRPVGGFGRVAAFSFYPTKNMTTGEGGMIVTDDDDVARTARLYRNQGMEVRYANEVVGYNNRMTDIAAAIGRVQLERLPGWNRTRRSNAAALDAGLAGVVGVTTPTVAEPAVHVYHQYTVRCEDRASVIARLEQADVGYGVYYPTPIHRLPSFALDLDLPVTGRAAEDLLSLPCHPDLSPDDLDAIIEAVTP
jgi:dTDP-4-amino-4,6-dideoxygalactose transaminase